MSNITEVEADICDAKDMTGGKSMPRTLSTTLPEHECIRVVPLYQPQIQQAVAANLTYRGGALVEAAKVFAIFLGAKLGRRC